MSSGNPLAFDTGSAQKPLMMAGPPGSIKNNKGNISVWRVPNVFFQSRESYLGGDDKFLSRFARLRTVLGVLWVIGIAVYYQNLGRVIVTRGSHHVTISAPVVGQFVNNRTTAWANGLAWSAFSILAVSLAIGLLARPGYRKTTFWQLRVPLLTLMLFVIFVAAVLLLFQFASNDFSPWTRDTNHMQQWIRIVLAFLFAFTVLPWGFKSTYLVTTGLFRADDGHPLLAPIVAPLVAWVVAFSEFFEGGSSSLPAGVRLLDTWGAPVALTISSIIIVLHLWRRYPQFPFRTGAISKTMILPSVPAHGTIVLDPTLASGNEAQSHWAKR